MFDRSDRQVRGIGDKDKFIPWQEEMTIRRLIQILSSRRKKNLVLIGEPDVAKTAI